MNVRNRMWWIIGIVGAVVLVALPYVRPEDCRVYPYGPPLGGYSFWENGGGFLLAAIWGFAFAAAYRYLATPSRRPMHRYLEAFVFGLLGAILLVLLVVPAGGRCL